MNAPRSGRRRFAAGVALGLLLAFVAWADRGSGMAATIFHTIAQLFYEKSALAELREPSQVALFRVHGLILGGIIAMGLIATPRLGSHARRLVLIFAVAYAIRAAVWIAGGNLPLVPGDSCHYVEIASSIYRGEGPVKHYVESFFTDYSAKILRDGAVLDDWATPLFAYLLAAVYRATGIVPGDSLESTFAVAKGTSFVLNLLTLPALYVFARRRFNGSIALAATAILGVLPVHATYGGFELRESLVALTSLLAVWTLTEVWEARGPSRWGWAVASGVFTGLAILSRNTAMALAAASGIYGLLAHGRRQLGQMLAWGVVTVAILIPWGWATFQEYGTPFHTYTKYFQYNFSWAVHHYAKGNTTASEFYTAANAAAIFRVKIKSLLLIATYSTMILSLPLAFGFVRRTLRGGGDVDRLVACIGLMFAAGTLATIADVTQVAQLGRYYLPVFVLMIPSAVAGLRDVWEDVLSLRARPLLAASLVALLWADPSWAFDFSWLSRTYQLHWPALRQAGDWVRSHPADVPADSRIMTWFPWELRLASRRTTILFNRSYYTPHLRQTMRQYRVTHVLWGSFEPPPDVDPELWSSHLTGVRLGLDLTSDRVLDRSPIQLAYPVTLYRTGEGRP